jgi:hypothetical protein
MFIFCFMIFDKEGNLADLNADRPTRMVKMQQPLLKKH